MEFKHLSTQASPSAPGIVLFDIDGVVSKSLTAAYNLWHDYLQERRLPFRSPLNILPILSGTAYQRTAETNIAEFNTHLATEDSDDNSSEEELNLRNALDQAWTALLDDFFDHKYIQMGTEGTWSSAVVTAESVNQKGFSKLTASVLPAIQQSRYMPELYQEAFTCIYQLANQGYILGILTAMSRSILQRILPKFNCQYQRSHVVAADIQSCFDPDLIICGDDIRTHRRDIVHSKPDPAAATYCVKNQLAKGVSLCTVANLFQVGDCKNDVYFALNSGGRSVCALYGYGGGVSNFVQILANDPNYCTFVNTEHYQSTAECSTAVLDSKGIIHWITQAEEIAPVIKQASQQDPDELLLDSQVPQAWKRNRVQFLTTIMQEAVALLEDNQLSAEQQKELLTFAQTYQQPAYATYFSDHFLLQQIEELAKHAPAVVKTYQSQSAVGIALDAIQQSS